MLHRIVAPDPRRKSRDRTILWDDLRGEVRGTHSAVRELDAMFERTKREVPLVIRSYHGNLILNDPRRSAPDFVALAGGPCTSISSGRIRCGTWRRRRGIPSSAKRTWFIDPAPMAGSGARRSSGVVGNRFDRVRCTPMLVSPRPPRKASGRHR